MPVETDKKRQIKPPRLRQFGGSLLILLTFLLLLNFIVPSFFGPRLPQVPYSDFIAQVQQGKVNRAIVGNESIEYVLETQTPEGKPAEQVLATRPVALDLDLPKILRDNHVEFAAPPPDQNGWIGTLLSWVAPPLIFFGIWGFFLAGSL
ncbi:hypothetical protein NUACC21_52610 [Scytonema sp. NUACC21]